MPELKEVTVPVLKTFTHEGREFHLGGSIRVAPVIALVLSRKGYVSLEPTYQTRAITTEPEPAPVRRGRGRPRKAEYQRSDMRAEE